MSCPVAAVRAVNSWNRTFTQYERLTINKDDGDESEPFAFVAYNQYSGNGNRINRKCSEVTENPIEVIAYHSYTSISKLIVLNDVE